MQTEGSNVVECVNGGFITWCEVQEIRSCWVHLIELLGAQLAEVWVEQSFQRTRTVCRHKNEESANEIDEHRIWFLLCEDLNLHGGIAFGK